MREVIKEESLDDQTLLKLQARPKRARDVLLWVLPCLSRNIAVLKNYEKLSNRLNTFTT